MCGVPGCWDRYVKALYVVAKKASGSCCLQTRDGGRGRTGPLVVTLAPRGMCQQVAFRAI